MKQYLELLEHILKTGVRKSTRAKLASTGDRVDAISIFGYLMRFDLKAGFPAVTTKKLAFSHVAHELIWFLRGSTNIAYLKEHGVKIWDEWADDNGNLGPVYGKQWRAWEGPDGQTVDQLGNILKDIETLKNDPTASVGRRLILTAWNPVEVPQMKLPPCHTLCQFMLTKGELSCQLYQRSADAFLGVPFNIASYALLTHLIAHVCGVGVGDFVHTFGDAHIYVNHIEQVQEQLRRTPLPLPQLRIDHSVKSLDFVTREQVQLLNYECHPAIKGEVAV